MMLQVMFNAIYKNYEDIQQEGKKAVPLQHTPIQFNKLQEDEKTEW